MKISGSFFVLFWIASSSALLAVASKDDSYKRVCYLLCDSRYQDMWIQPKQMQWSLCTHLLFAFADIHDGTIWVNQTMQAYINKMMQSNQTSNLKYMISVGASSSSFSQSMVDGKSATKLVISSSLILPN